METTVRRPTKGREKVEETESKEEEIKPKRILPWKLEPNREKNEEKSKEFSHGKQW